MNIQSENTLKNKRNIRRSHPTPKEVGFPAYRRKIASKILRDKRQSKGAKAVAGSALTQRPDKKKE
jgi:hypothetical protein